MSQDHSVTLNSFVTGVTDRLTIMNAARDEVLGHGRQAIRHAANSVRALHRGDFDQADDLLAQSRVIVDQIRDRTADLPQIYFAGYVQDALKEYAEAAITRSLLRDEPVPDSRDLGIEDAAWLNALAEAGSELRRDVLDVLRHGDLARADQLLTAMDQIYSVLVTIDFPDALTGGLRRTTDQFRAVLERTRGDVTVTMQQRRLEAAIRELQGDLSRREAPGS
jgi:translin